MAIAYEIPENVVIIGSRRRRGYELADILKRYLSGYLKTHRISAHQHKVLTAIQRCRTKALGAHVRKCDDCDYMEVAYNSCRDRHCPKCQGSARHGWIKDRLSELLPIPYYHVVITMPHELNDLCLCNQSVVYDIFFKSSSEALLELGKDPKYLGGNLGITSVLHTWGQRLNYHVHLHMIVTGGGISLDGNSWKALPYREKFLFPTKVVSKLICGKFIAMLKEAFYQGKLKFPGKLDTISTADYFEVFLSDLASKSWINYAKRPFAGPEAVVEYVGNYTNRVAIANSRLQAIDDDAIRFGYKDYKDGHQSKSMKLSAEEFIRRFLLHILPEGFKKIRYYGILAGNKRKMYIEKARKLLAMCVDKAKRLIDKVSEFTQKTCPNCQKASLRVIDYIPARQMMAYNNSS